MLDDARQITDIRTRVLYLQSLPEFASIERETLGALAEAARVRRYASGAPIVRRGRALDRVLVLLQGSVTVKRGLDAGVEIAAPGVIGWIAVLAGDPSGLTVDAKAPVSALEIPATRVRALIERDFGLVRTALAMLSKRILDARGPLPVEVPSELIGEWRDRELTTAEKLLRLRDTSWGRAVNVDAIAELARDIREVRFERGDVIWRSGDRADGWLRIDYGRARCEAQEGAPVDAGPGQVLGLFDALADAPRQFTAVASTPVIALEVRLGDLLAVLEAHPQLVARMTALLAQQLA